jgi:hypothetical protein
VLVVQQENFPGRKQEISASILRKVHSKVVSNDDGERTIDILRIIEKIGTKDNVSSII